jgi:hypothetical protein
MTLDLHCFFIFGHNGIQLGLEFFSKIAVVFPSLLSPYCQPLFYFILLLFWKEMNFKK